MKQKYSILRDPEKKQLVLKEFAELDKEILSFLCEETYDEDVIKSAATEGKAALIVALRTRNMYPPMLYADRIADSVMAIYASAEEDAPNHSSIDIFFNDIDFLTKEEKELEQAENTEEKAEDIDDLLEDDEEDNEGDFHNKNAIDPMNSPLKIADDDSLEVAED